MLQQAASATAPGSFGGSGSSPEHRRTEINKKIHLIDKTVKDDPNSAMIKNSITEKCITPFITSPSSKR